MPQGGRGVQDVRHLAQYGLGSKRSLDQLIEFTGIDFRGAKIYGHRCGAEAVGGREGTEEEMSVWRGIDVWVWVCVYILLYVGLWVCRSVVNAIWVCG